jgi:hypothetical protein
VAEYARDLAARGAGPENATRITKNLIPTLATKPVGLLTTRDLSAWRDRLLRDGMKPATMVRLGRAVKAALNLAARRDPRITNRNTWADGFSELLPFMRAYQPRKAAIEAIPDLKRLWKAQRPDRTDPRAISNRHARRAASGHAALSQPRAARLRIGMLRGRPRRLLPVRVSRWTCACSRSPAERVHRLWRDA